MQMKRILTLSFLLFSQVMSKPQPSYSMEVTKLFQNLTWLKSDWCLPSMTKETNELMRQCTEIPDTELNHELEDIISRSKNFPIPFPIETVRLNSLKKHRPVDRLKKNIASTYPVVHERVLMIMTHFLMYKREYGSNIEKIFYKDMTVPELIDRLLKKRAVTFMNAEDQYLLLDGKTGSGGWDAVGTPQQRAPLVLENVLSYDEIKLSAFVFVSGETECINDGSRHNSGVVEDEDVQQHAVIIGAIGARFEHPGRMDYEDIVISNSQNTVENGYGEHVAPTTCLHVLRHSYVRDARHARDAWRQLWAELYQEPSYTYGEALRASSALSERYVSLSRGALFDKQVYAKRLQLLADTLLLEAERRAVNQQRHAFLNLVGFGLGVWRIVDEQRDVLVVAVMERVKALLDRGALHYLSDVNFAYVEPSDNLKQLFTDISEDESPPVRKTFLKNNKHPKGGISVQLQKREPSSRLKGEHAEKLLVMAYPWDGNALPGNEFWLGSLSGSGDPAAACSTQVAELHNPHINPVVNGNNTHVAARSSLLSLRDYCTAYIKTSDLATDN